ncbi:LysR family transcriptional regulator [Kordiimonas sediminis]|uniref:LysR family transcriptional regulator n=1 Tax=Kordiimonas sediminis TaxID=1735581 RepID=A0A919AP11_9PROT|nr:transcriptional regulator GcvA [Kordiimonas sediminis]GHF17151.1 LysR family transcriptional regulator [Kordiimonas sediminis]
MKRSLLPLNALRAFDAAARHMSFKKAADDLSVTPAAISQQIRSLEDILGVELFRRTNRSLILTEAAQLSLAALKEGFEKMEEAVDILTQSKSHNVIKVSVSPSFASKWLVPRLASYYERRPDAIVKISATMSLTDFNVEDIDLAIRYGSGKYPGLEVIEILRETVFPVCSPELLESSKPIKKPADLKAHTLIHDDSFSDDDSAPNWSMWLRAAGVNIEEGLPALHFNTHSLAIEAAVAGRGVALARSAIAEEDLKAGRLVKLFDEVMPVGFAHHIVSPAEKIKSERVLDFIDWLVAEAADTDESCVSLEPGEDVSAL